MNCGIYCITNTIDGKRYIGSSKNTKQRKYKHFYYLKAGTHPNIHLQSSYNKYGKEVFHFVENYGISSIHLVYFPNWYE